MKLVNRILALTAAAFLAGCSHYMGPVAMLDNAQPVGSPYTKELAIQYRMLADSLSGDAAKHFAEKGLAAVNGEMVPPDMLSDDPVSFGGPNPAAVAVARGELIKALASGGPAMAPYQAAIAQTRYDGWADSMQKFPGDNESCQQRYKIAMNTLQQEIAVPPMPNLPPPSSPAPAPEVAQTFPAPVTPSPRGAEVPLREASFLAFFDWDKYNINSGASAVLESVVREIMSRSDIKKIHIAGYTDTSGPERYNMKLSLKRAKAVRRYLIEHGVSAKKITVKGYGEHDLLVPTADGVREPRNRRAQITFE